MTLKPGIRKRMTRKLMKGIVLILCQEGHLRLRRACVGFPGKAMAKRRHSARFSPLVWYFSRHPL